MVADLDKARKNKADEFYTQLDVIEDEMRYYLKVFKNKVVYCNCDDPYESNFFKYFAMNFNFLGLKKLLTVSYKGSPIADKEVSLFDPVSHGYVIEISEVKDENNDGAINLSDVKYLLDHSKKNILRQLDGDGDFQSEECIQFLKQADIVVTNPPFSLFRKYLAQLMRYKKKFIIIGDLHDITYKEVFPLIKANKIWLGASIHSGDREFRVPDYYPLEAAGFRVDENGIKYIRVKGVRWFTNIDHKQRHEELTLYKKYNEEEYPFYANYHAISVGKTTDIPDGYWDEMGVPITFMDKYNPDQFEIIGSSGQLAQPMKQVVDDGTFSQGGPAFYLKGHDKKYDYHRLFYRIVIKRKNNI